jgi:hypothetical protein
MLGLLLLEGAFPFAWIVGEPITAGGERLRAIRFLSKNRYFEELAASIKLRGSVLVATRAST